MAGLNFFGAANLKGDITDCTLTETGDKRVSKEIPEQHSNIHHDRKMKSDQAQLFHSTDQKQPNRFYFQNQQRKPHSNKKKLCAQIALLLYYLTYILWLFCSSVVTRSKLTSPKNSGGYWTLTVGQILAVVACMVLILFCSEKHSRKTILIQFACSIAFLLLGFVKYGVSDQSSSVIEITIVFTVGQSIALMLMTLNQRRVEREHQIDNWIKIHPFTKTHRFSSIITRKVIKEPPLHKISSRGIEEEELDFNKKVLNFEEEGKEEESFNFKLFSKMSKNKSSKRISQKMSFASSARGSQNNSVRKKATGSGKKFKSNQDEDEADISTNNEVKEQNIRKSDHLGQFGIFRHLESQENIPGKD